MWFRKKDQESYTTNQSDERELLKKVKNIQLQSKKIVTDVMAGEYQSAFKGQGMDFDRVREYQSGDDPRQIDWNVTARQGTPYVKTYIEERELTIMFLIDHSASGLFGTVGPSKRDFITELTATLAFSAIKKNDKVGMLLFSDHVEAFIPPKKGKSHVLRVIRDLLCHQSAEGASNLTQALEFLNPILKGKAVIFLLSDFLDLELCKHLRQTAFRHDVVALEVYDPLEEAPFNLGLVEFQGLENGHSSLVDTNHKGWQKAYQAKWQERLRDQKTFFRKQKIDHLRLDCNLPYETQLRQLFKKRAKKS